MRNYLAFLAILYLIAIVWGASFVAARMVYNSAHVYDASSAANP